MKNWKVQFDILADWCANALGFRREAGMEFCRVDVNDELPYGWKFYAPIVGGGIMACRDVVRWVKR